MAQVIERRWNRNRSSVAAAVMGAALALGAVAGSPFARMADAQNLGDRTVRGTVLSAESAPVAGATVFLKNEKTKAIRSFTSIADGHFQFSQVNKDQDYDLWAEKDGKKSAVKTVSSWDARNDVISDLKLR
jgi:hypothetical protein